MEDYSSNGAYIGNLETHKYKDSGDEVFYVCPICGHEYLEGFFFVEDGETKCIDCCTK